MTIPLILLAVGSVVAGAFLSMATVRELARAGRRAQPRGPAGQRGLTVTGATLAVLRRRRRPRLAAVRRAPGPGRRRAARWSPPPPAATCYGDAFNEVSVRGGERLTRSLVFFDNRGIDGLVNGLAAAVGGTSGRLRRLQTGFVRSYACPCSAVPRRGRRAC